MLGYINDSGFLFCETPNLDDQIADFLKSHNQCELGQLVLFDRVVTLGGSAKFAFFQSSTLLVQVAITPEGLMLFRAKNRTEAHTSSFQWTVRVGCVNLLIVVHCIAHIRQLALLSFYCIYGKDAWSQFL